MYRIHLWLLYYKLYLAQQIQTESVPLGNVLERIVIPDDSVIKIPSIVSMVIDCAGKVESGDRVYHMGIAVPPVEIRDIAEYLTLAIFTTTIRQLLVAASNAVVPVNPDFENHWSIPGGRFENGRLQNANEIYPVEYTVAMLHHDVHCYKNLVT